MAFVFFGPRREVLGARTVASGDPAADHGGASGRVWTSRPPDHNAARSTRATRGFGEQRDGPVRA